MLTRRHFIRDTASATAGMVVVGGGVGGATTTGVQPSSTGERRQVVVGGRRVKTVDVHSHCEIPGIREMMGGAPSAIVHSSSARTVCEKWMHGGST